MNRKTVQQLYRFIFFLALATLFTFIVTSTPHSQAAPTAPPYLDMVNVSAPDINCVFDSDCTIFVNDVASTFTLTGSTGSSFLQSRMFPRGEVGTPGAGLYSYEYRIDMREMVGTGNSGCVSTLTIDFGPVVPMDYDGDGNKEDVFVVTGGGLGTIAPLAVTKTGDSVKFDFANDPICGDESEKTDNGESTFFFGLASPFRDREITAVIEHNTGAPLDLIAHAPNYTDGISLQVVPNEGSAGSTVQFIGYGYVPGNYPGNILWEGALDTGFDIPRGGAFSVPYTIPNTAPIGTHTITACAKGVVEPCTTGDFEQSADALFTVTQAQRPSGEHTVFLPIIIKDGGNSEPEPFGYVVDNDVKPSLEKLPGIDGGAERPLTAVEDPHGNVATFVANEIVLQTDDKNALNAFLSRTDGEILLEMDPQEYDVDGLDPLYLVRVNLGTADTSNFTNNIESLMDSDIGSAGEFAFADSAGVQVFSIAAEEAMSGLTVGINWVSDAGAIPFNSTEAASGAALFGVAYTPNAYDWAHFAAGTTQDIGVPEAWTLMHRAGKLGNTVDVAILDGGFYPNADFPTGTTYLNIFPFDPRNVPGVDGGAPYHGTDVLQTVAARGDNNNGVVGVAAPIVHPIALYTSYDFFVSIGSVLMARGAGAEIMNMSYSADVPSIFGFTVLPFEATTAAVRASGALLFASAGNSNKDVDGQDCIFRLCWEHTWHTPCENAGVICVGGLRWNSQMKAGGTTGDSGSNYGHEHVDIFAPYTVYGGQTPARPNRDDVVGFVNGTSFSSPYAASVAALIWASDPSLNANQVWTILRDTAHTSPDPLVNRYVNAYDAVLSAIGVGMDVTLTSPVHGASYDQGYPLNLQANVGFVDSVGSTPLQVRWYVDGSLFRTISYTPGIGSHVLHPQTTVNGLSAGAHTIMIRATAGSEVVERSATINIVNSAPTLVSIDQPSNSASFCPGETINFRGSAFDLNEVLTGGLPNSAFAWRSSINGSLGTGKTRSISSLSSGSHIITLRVTDSGGLWDEDTITLTILSPSHPSCVDLSPTANIASPANGYSVYADAFDGTYWYKQITFSGTISDNEDAIGDLTVGWYSDLQGYLGSGTVNTSTGAVSLTKNIRAYAGCGSTHTITLRVTDTYGNITEDQIVIHVNVLC